MLRYKTFLLCLMLPFMVFAQDYSYKFRVLLNDKGSTPFNIDNPQMFLSEKSIERRLRQNIAIDESDLPISAQYISDIEALGCVIVAKSKWLQSVSIHCNDSSIIDSIKKLDFVKDVAFAWKGASTIPKIESKKTKDPILRSTNKSEGYYGVAYKQIAIHSGDSLHRAGYQGEGMEIAVLDAGFSDMSENLLLSNVQVKEFKDFIYQGNNVIQSVHGTNVLSCMAANHPTIFVGTAPKAKYWLLRTEDPTSEFPIEEDYWVAAAEYADSVGVDLINSSLGYTSFDPPAQSFTNEQMDGKTTFIALGAGLAVSKGIFVVTSAGNEGYRQWRHISTPGDEESVLTIGSVANDSIISSFSSRGPTADMRIKPDVMAIGSNPVVIDTNGEIVNKGGTSFSSPIMCGLAACLWQAYPNLTNRELAQIIKQSADRYANPNNDYGYGIPNMIRAMNLAENQTTTISEIITGEDFNIIPEGKGSFKIRRETDDSIKYNVMIYTIDGRLILSDSFIEQEKIYTLPSIQKSIYIIKVFSVNFTQSQKVLL